MMFRRIALCLASVALLASCSTDSDNGLDAVPDTVVELVSKDTTLDAPVEKEVEVIVEDIITGPAARGWLQPRGIVHLHSAYSHDGCGPDGYEDYGGPDPECLAELRAAPCANHISFMMMTDHPGEVKHHTYEEGLQYREDLGDELVMDHQGRPFANIITCPEGSTVEKVFVYFGTEGSKHMPIGLAGPVPDIVFETKYGDEEQLDNSKAAVEVVHELEGYAFCCHTEEPNISVERIKELPLDGMEIYNLHANLMMGLESMDTIFMMNDFMGNPEGGPNPDLSLLLFLGHVAKDLEKFDASAPYIHLAHIAATDIHRNVEIPALCPGEVEGSICEAFAEDFPNFVEFARVGGAVPLSDGDRVDSYARSFRWFSNRPLVKEMDPQEIREAIGMGRSYSVFETMAYADGFDYYVEQGPAEAPEVLELGAEASFTDGMTAHIVTPTLVPPAWRTDEGINYGAGEVWTQLIRATDTGSEVIAESTKQGETLVVPLPGTGAYRVQAEIRPRHLEPLLAGLKKLASGKYPYIYTNAIFLR